MDMAIGGGSNGGRTRYCGRRISATWPAPHHRLLPYRLDLRYRPISDIYSFEFVAAKPSLALELARRSPRRRLHDFRSTYSGSPALASPA